MIETRRRTPLTSGTGPDPAGLREIGAMSRALRCPDDVAAIRAGVTANSVAP